MPKALAITCADYTAAARTSSVEGVMVGNRKRRVEFAEQMGIYVLYDKWEQPVQIGQSKVIFKRLKQHRRDHLRNRWSLFSWFGFFKVGTNNKLLVKDQTIELKRTLTLEDSLNELEAILTDILQINADLKTTLRQFVVIGKPGSPRTRLRRV
jgi:hypothetical protein